MPTNEIIQVESVVRWSSVAEGEARAVDALAQHTHSKSRARFFVYIVFIIRTILSQS